MRKRHWLPVIAAALALVTAVFATTWSSAKLVCPLCHTKNSFNIWNSYGSYIYNWPSKYQLIYWPSTDGSSVYTCKKCYLSLFMWDFEKLPPDKAGDVQKALADVTLSREFKNYTDLPMSERLGIAEKVYKVLDKDQEFWCTFYRIQAYYFAREKKQSEAEAARSKALLIAEKLITDPANAGRVKELLLIRGAMHHFLNNDAAAKQDLEAALQATYTQKELTEEQNKNANTNLDALIKEYLKRIADGTVPKDDGSDEREG